MPNRKCNGLAAQLPTGVGYIEQRGEFLYHARQFAVGATAGNYASGENSDPASLTPYSYTLP